MRTGDLFDGPRLRVAVKPTRQLPLIPNCLAACSLIAPASKRSVEFRGDRLIIMKNM
jgi:hypothetical protein